MAIITLVGRPNVGKSSLFNRLIGKKTAIVDDIPGVTRDRLYGEVTWQGESFYVVDTGGIESPDAHPFIAGIEQQVEIALQESDGIIFLLDGTEGITASDEAIAMRLRRKNKPVLVAMNKIDSERRDVRVHEAYALGFDNVIAISVEHNRNTSEVLDFMSDIAAKCENWQEEDAEEVKVALIGRPNVGKSTLFNRLLGEERALVSDIPGTTRDTLDSIVELDGIKIKFTDTAGLRRKSRVHENIEYYSNVRTFQAIDRCDVVIVMLDAGELLTEQDKRLVGHATQRGKGLILAVNKWDTLVKTQEAGDKVRGEVRDELPLAAHAPLIFISGLTGRGVNKIPQYIKTVSENRRRRITTAKLNKLLRETLDFEYMPGDTKGRVMKIYYITQADCLPPTFLFFVNYRDLVNNQFLRRMEKLIRSLDDFSGTPLRIWLRNRGEE